MEAAKIKFDHVKGSKRLQELRKGKGVSSETLASETGINKQSLIDYEKAGKNIDKDYNTGRIDAFAGMSVNNLVILADYFDVSTDYLLGLTDKQTSDVDVLALLKETGLSQQAATNLIQVMTDDEMGFISSTALSAIFDNRNGLYSLASGVYALMIECEQARDYIGSRDDSSEWATKAYQDGKAIDKMELAYFKAREEFRRILDKVFDYQSIIDKLQGGR